MMSIALLALLSAPPVPASSSLSFEASGFWIDMEVGDADAPVIAGVRFHRDGDAQGVRLPRASWSVEAFDVERRLLKLHYRGDAGNRVLPFELTVDGEQALFWTIGSDELIPAHFDWQM